jgi:putative pyruvate formate lyase activating enzyme
MRFLADELSPDTFVNMMGQYRPAHKVGGDKYPEINKPISGEEMRRAYEEAKYAGIWRFDQRRARWLFL